MKKLLILFLAVLVAGVALAGGQSEAEGPKTLLVAAPPWIQKKTATLSAAEGFQKAHADVKVEVIGADLPRHLMTETRLIESVALYRNAIRLQPWFGPCCHRGQQAGVETSRQERAE